MSISHQAIFEIPVHEVRKCPREAAGRAIPSCLSFHHTIKRQRIWVENPRIKKTNEQQNKKHPINDDVRGCFLHAYFDSSVSVVSATTSKV